MHGRQYVHENKNETVMISISSLDLKNPIIKTNKDLIRKKEKSQNLPSNMYDNMYMKLKMKQS